MYFSYLYFNYHTTLALWKVISIPDSVEANDIAGSMKGDWHITLCWQWFHSESL